ncbi:MAG: SDR family NAD(P)-dependent oxidoreductase [Ruminococcus sp.]|nr:SDR family NAD(P)-dependent oxidoreductase [Ruminococcus sp.]
MIKEKNIVLTGCNSGIGLEVLKLLVEGKNKILAVDKNINKLSQFSAEYVMPMQIDVSSKEAVDEIFETALEKLGSIDIFYANAGYPYYEEFNYVDWDRVDRMFETNVLSPIYSYQKYAEYLAGRNGIFAVTISAIGKMAMPGFTVYSASKFAMEGFQQGLRLEMPKNIQLTCLYPVATNTNFFKAANEIEFKKPFPVQQPDVVARKMLAGIESGKKSVSPCALFGFATQLMKFAPFVRNIYWGMEKRKFNEFKAKVKEIKEKELSK